MSNHGFCIFCGNRIYLSGPSAMVKYCGHCTISKKRKQQQQDQDVINKVNGTDYQLGTLGMYGKE